MLPNPRQWMDEWIASRQGGARQSQHSTEVCVMHNRGCVSANKFCVYRSVRERSEGYCRLPRPQLLQHLVSEPLHSRLQTCADTGCTSDLALSVGINLTFLGGRLRPRTFQDFSMSDIEAVFLGFCSGTAFSFHHQLVTTEENG